MLSKKEVISDLNSICAQTKARWLCYDDIHTVDWQSDTKRYLKELNRIGYSAIDSLAMGYMDLAYGGGLEINHQEEARGGGYTLNGKNNNKRKLVVLSGSSRLIDYHTIYHEAGHLYQFEYNIFNVRYRDEYETYLSETHANTFAAMVLLLKAQNMIEYKKKRLALLANSVNTVNDKRKKLLYYVSLPIELELMKIIKREGRKNMRLKFSKKDNLDFKKIAFFTADLVRKYGFTREEFKKMQEGAFVKNYENLKRKAKAHRILGKAFLYQQKFLWKKQEKCHTEIEKERITKIPKRLNPLAEGNKEVRMINAACALDNFQVRLFQEYKIFDCLSEVVEDKVCKVPEEYKKNLKALEEITATFDKMKTIYQKWQDDPYFQDLTNKLLFIETRDEVWAIKEEKRKEQQKQKFQFKIQNER